MGLLAAGKGVPAWLRCCGVTPPPITPPGRGSGSHSSMTSGSSVMTLAMRSISFICVYFNRGVMDDEDRDIYKSILRTSRSIDSYINLRQRVKDARPETQIIWWRVLVFLVITLIIAIIVYKATR